MNALSDALLLAQTSGQRIPADGAISAPHTLAEAYAIQGRVIEGMDADISGFKTARKPDQPSIWAPIVAHRTWDSGATVPMGAQMGLELEIGWRIMAPLPAPEDVDFDAALLRCILPVPVIELVETRLNGAIAQDPLAKLADFQINHGLILGTPLTTWDGRDFGIVNARMTIPTGTILDGETSVPDGSALTTLKALIRSIGNHCGGLKPGQTVITGSIHPLTYTPTAGDVFGRIDGLGEVSCHLT
ncbi:hydratase [Albirhodobacter sp. R86504]|uniref:hydratase n=1 Tax=Albirhodobacter sp. R86504 TaxID=3093848 RepID=UPI00366AEC03